MAAWGTDGPVSVPVARGQQVQADFQGFCFTLGGISHLLTDTERENLLLGMYAPPLFEPED